MSAPVVECLGVFPLRIALRGNVLDTAGGQSVARPVVVSVEFRGGTMGFGEASGLTGATDDEVEQVIDAVSGRHSSSELFAAVASFHPDSFPEALEVIENLPWKGVAGERIAPIRAAVEIALLDAAMRFFRRGMDDVVTWMGLPSFGKPGSIKQARYAGVLVTGNPAETVKLLRRMRRRGIRNFKLKMTQRDDRESLRRVGAILSGSLWRGRSSLCIDAGGALSRETLIEMLEEATMMGCPISALEQPVKPGEESGLPALRELCGAVLICDESLGAVEDARGLIEQGGFDGFTITISRLGGLLPALRLAELVRRSKLEVRLGCAPGETSILSAAGVRFLEVCPGVVWAEGCSGRLTLSDDPVSKPVRFRYGGKPPRLPGDGLGADVDQSRLERLCDRDPVVIHL